MCLNLRNEFVMWEYIFVAKKFNKEIHKLKDKRKTY